MSFRIKTHGHLGDELRRVVEEEISAALKELETLDRSDTAEAVHEARKHFKKLRATVQLLREPLGVKRIRAEEACYRKIGRKFRKLRDAQALTATLDNLAKRFFEARRPPIVLAARHLLATEAHQALRTLERKDGLAAVLTGLREARERTAAWKIDDFRWKHLATALRRSYRRAREAWHHACAEPKPRRLHDWRRRTKELWYHVTLAHCAAPTFMEELAGEFEVLGEFLGDDHDLIVLRKVLEDHPRQVPAGQARDALFDIIALRREELLGAAFDLAGRVFAESPGAFLRALEARRHDHRQRHKKATQAAERLAALGQH
jgi:CHAD domain-containing protein